MTSHERILEALAYVRPTDRDTWLRIGMAVKSEMGDDGFDLWDTWSQADETYRAADARSVWKSIHSNGKITIGTLFHDAKRHGWSGGKSNGNRHALSEAERAEREQRRQQEQEAEARRRQDAQREASEIWSSSKPAPEDHAYLVRKAVKAHGVRIYSGNRAIGNMSCDGALLVPVRDAVGEVCTLEFISAQGEKRFLPGGRKSGGYFSIGRHAGAIVIAEGFATGASVHEATGHATAVAFDKGNLRPVALALRGKFPDVRIIIVADDDYETTGNPGMTAAREAAAAVGGLVAVPDFGADRSDGAKDFNDLLLARGAEAVRAAIQSAQALPEPDTVTDDDADESSRIARRIAELAKLSRVDYDRARKATAKVLGIQLSTLDAEVATLRKELQGDAGLTFEDPEPWPAPVAGAELLLTMRAQLEKYLVLPAHAATAIALWSLHTWCLDAFFISPLLYPRSPEKRCGKTTLMIVVHELVRRPLLATNIAPAPLFRCVAEFRPTLLLDEADAWLKENEELRGILNGGHSRKTAKVIRCVGDEHDVRAFSTFCPKAVAGIGRLADTLADRSIIIPMKRKRPQDCTAPLREDRFDLSDIRRRCRRWADDEIEVLRQADPKIPTALNDRAADNWRALLAIADAAGGDWPREARTAAMALSGQADDEAIGTQLLSDIRSLFDRLEDFGRSDDDGGRAIASAALIERLGAMEDRPWAEWRHGKPITAPQMARLLRAFDVRPRTIRIGNQTAKGYLHEQFADAFSRYLPANSQAATPSQPHQFASESDASSRNSSSDAIRHIVTPAAKCDGVTVTQNSDVTASNGTKAYENRICDGVTAQNAPGAAAQAVTSDSEVF